MNVSCPSCPAKYLVPDAKIRGRRLRMVCKRCGTPFVVDGTEATGEPEDAADDRALRPDWVVMVNDRDATQMSSRHLVELYALGAVHARTRVWRAGTEEAGTPFDFPEIAALLAARGLHPETEVAQASSLVDYPQDEDATVVGYPTLQARFPGGARGRQARADAFDDQTTVAVARSSALAQSLRNDWAPEGVDAASERTVSGDVRALVADSGSFEDDEDPELGVARLPAHLVDHPEFASILIAPNSGEEPVAPSPQALANADRDPPAISHDAADSGRPRRRERRPEPRPPTPAAGAPAKTHEPPSSRRERVSTGPPDPAVRPSRPPATVAGSAGPRRSSPSLHPLLVTSESRIPPPPAVIPPPRVVADGTGREASPGGPIPVEVDLDDLPPELRPRRRRPWLWLRALTLLVLLVGAGLAGLYAYDRALLVAVVPELPRLLPGLFPPPPAPTPAAVPTRAAVPTPASSPTPALRSAPSASAEPVDAEVTDTPEIPPDAGLFNRKAAVAALAVTAQAAKVCFDPDARIYGGMVIVTFAPSGRPTKIDLHGKLPGTAVGDCVAQAFERVRIEPFRGEPVPVGHHLTLP